MFIFAANDGTDMLANSISGLVMVPSNFGLRYFLKYIQLMLWSIMKFFPVFLVFYRLKLKLYMSNFSQRYATL